MASDRANDKALIIQSSPVDNIIRMQSGNI